MLYDLQVSWEPSTISWHTSLWLYASDTDTQPGQIASWHVSDRQHLDAIARMVRHANVGIKAQESNSFDVSNQTWRDRPPML